MRTLSISPAQMFISGASSARPRAVQREECEARLSSGILCLLIYLSTEIEVLEEALWKTSGSCNPVLDSAPSMA